MAVEPDGAVVASHRPRVFWVGLATPESRSLIQPGLSIPNLTSSSRRIDSDSHASHLKSSSTDEFSRCPLCVHLCSCWVFLSFWQAARPPKKKANRPVEIERGSRKSTTVLATIHDQQTAGGPAGDDLRALARSGTTSQPLDQKFKFNRST